MGQQHGSATPKSANQLQPIRKNIQQHRKRLAKFESNVRLIVSRQKLLTTGGSTDYSILNQFASISAASTKPMCEAHVLEFTTSMANRLRFCDRLYNEYLLETIIASRLRSLHEQLESQTGRVYKEISNPKVHANNQLDIDRLCRRAEKQLGLYEESHRSTVLDAFRIHSRFCHQHSRIRATIYKAMLECAEHANESSADRREWQGEVKRRVDSDIVQMINQILGTNIAERTKQLALIRDLSDQGDFGSNVEAPPAYHALFGIPDWTVTNSERSNIGQ